MEYVVILGLTVTGFIVVFLFLRRRIDKMVNPRLILDEIRVEVDKIILQLNNITDRNISLIEDKIHTLEELITRADKKIMLLERETEKYHMSKDYTSILRKGAKTVVGKPGTEETDIKSQVLKLHREGFSPEVISGRINLPVGEVELIISLQERKEYHSE